jgi:hypothetical protein
LIFIIEKILNFLFVFSLFLLVLYILGNFQVFLDRTQKMLLKTLMVSTLMGGILSIYSLGYYFLLTIWIRKFIVGRFLLYLLIFIFNSTVLVLLKFFTSWFQI